MDGVEEEYVALHRAVLVDPGDDTVRLALADYLDEHPRGPCPDCGGGRPGNWHYAINDEMRCTKCGRRGCDGDGLVDDGTRRAHAKLIRTQIALARGAPCDHARGPGKFQPRGRCDWCDLLRREKELVLGHWRRLLEGIGVPYDARVCGNYPDHTREYSGSLFWFDRGFVNKVRLTAARFYGSVCMVCEGEEECRMCHGTGSVEDEGGRGVINCPNGYDDDNFYHGRCRPVCRDCGGVPEYEGAAKKLFELHPVTEVVLYDRSPDGMAGNPAIPWTWDRAGENTSLDRLVRITRDLFDAENAIPPEIFDLLPPSGPSEYPGEEWTTTSEAGARAALSAACVKYGRAAAELGGAE